MSFVDEWNLSYPIPNSIYSENTLSVRGRTVGQGGAGQYELKGSGSLANGDTLTAVDIIGHAIILEVVVPSTGQVVSLGTRYPVAKKGGKVRVQIQGDGAKRPNAGNLFAALLLLPVTGKVNDSSPLQEDGFAERTFWMDAAEVKPVGVSEDAYILELTKLFFATGSRYKDGQFSGAIDYDYKSRIDDLIALCNRGCKMRAGSLTTAFKYFADVYAGKLEFDYSVAEFMRNLIASQLIAEEGIDYEQGDDVLPAMHQLIDLAAKNSSKASSREKRTFQLNNLPAEFKTDFSRRYITSLLAKPFVILAGNSGTGKTRISKRFAKYLEVLDEDGEPNWLLVPVGADWTDNTKVLGFFNPIADGGKGAYEETGILRLIERANANPEVPYFLILDEMNLSHVERYFSDFLSHMETIGEDNLIVLDGYGDGGAGRLPYPQNLFVVGTVNIDETTYMFSPKVLDRANVIEFKPSKAEVLAGFKAIEDAPDVAVAASGVPQAFLRLAKDIWEGANYISEDDANAIFEKFGKLYEELEKCGYEFAFRTVREVRMYVNAAHELDGGNYELERSVDEQIVQKVLPKLHGNKREIGNLLKSLKDICDGELSSVKISQMAAKLDNVQYASFI